MNITTISKILMVLLLGLSLTVQAKCPPGPNTLVIKQANGFIQSLSLRPEAYTEDETTNAPYFTYFTHYGTVHIGPGDTVIATIGYSSCGGNGFIRRDGVTISNAMTWGSLVFKCTLAGAYEGGNCDEGCQMLTFEIAPLAGASGPVTMAPQVLLEGAAISTSSNSMRTDLKAQGLLPVAEPYTSLGYSFVGGGGGEILGPNASAQPIVDWVVLELRDANLPSTVVASKAALVLSNGTVVDAGTFGYPQFSVVPGYYYVAIKHRSHLGVMTGVPILLNAEPIVNVGFRYNTLPLYGTDALHTVGTRRFLWPGNGQWTSGPQQIKYTGPSNDRDAVLSRIGGSLLTSAVSGYHLEDLNLDGVVKYSGASNDRDVILQSIGGTVTTATRAEQIP